MKTNYLCAESDFFIGRKGRLKRYLICSMQGYFPVITKTGPQSLAAVYRTGGPHLSLAATIAVSTSNDGGKSWTDPSEITPRWEDSRNPAMGVNNKGELVVAFWKSGDSYEWVDGKENWKGRQESDWGSKCFTTISTDDGKTWSEPTPMKFSNIRNGSPYGQIIQNTDGTLLMCINGIPADGEDDKRVACVIRSRDGGKTWGDESVIAYGYHETAFVEASDGTLVAATRNAKEGGLYSLFSTDRGYTWSEPQQITLKGEHPACLTLLQSGKILLTFGRRIRPMGCGALLSGDNGRTWNRDREILLAGDGILNSDLGYPSTAQLDNGDIVTAVYYSSGSETSAELTGWGQVSCQAIHYCEEDII